MSLAGLIFVPVLAEQVLLQAFLTEFYRLLERIKQGGLGGMMPLLVSAFSKLAAKLPVVFVLTVLVQVFCLSAVIRAASDICLGRPAGLGRSLKTAGTLFLPVLGAVVVYYFLLAIMFVVSSSKLRSPTGE